MSSEKYELCLLDPCLYLKAPCHIKRVYIISLCHSLLDNLIIISAQNHLSGKILGQIQGKIIRNLELNEI